MSTAELYLFGQVILGYIVQWVRGFQKVPNWVAYTLLAVASLAIYFWVTPDFIEQAKTDWRSLLAMLISFALASRGTAATAKDAKAAPNTNSL